MGRSLLRTALEISLPLIAVYLLTSGIPESIQSLIFSPSTPSSAQNPPIPKSFSDEYLQWATDTLSLPGLSTSNDSPSHCPSHSYKTHVYSRQPLMLYIENFLSEAEVDAILESTASNFEPSTIWAAGVESSNSTVRKSLKAPLSSRDDGTSSIARCIEERALALQGWRSDVFVEKLSAQKYEAGGHYSHHFDWGSDGRGGAGRVSSFMVWLGDECDGGGTNFPRIPNRNERAWCEFLDCGDAGGERIAKDDSDGWGGTTWMPVKGNAVFWENFDDDGRGRPASWHAGLPVRSGVKVGLNIWSWWQPGLEEALRSWSKREDRSHEQE